LYRLERGEIEEVLGLYDGPIRRGRSSEWLDIVDAASCGGFRFSGLTWGSAPKIFRRISKHFSVNPFTFSIIGTRSWRSALRAAAIWGSRSSPTPADTPWAPTEPWRSVRGLALLEGFSSFAAGQFDRATEVLSAVRLEAHAVEGSHAQRDVIDLTLIAAAARSGQTTYAEPLVGERVRRTPTASSATQQLLVANTR
jgi:hypothetical protein